MFGQFNNQVTTGVSLQEYVSMLKGTHTSEVYMAIAKRFVQQDKNGDGKLCREEFVSCGANPQAAMSGGGELVFPTPGLIVDIDEEFEEFEVLILPGDDCDVEYRYFGVTYLVNTLPNPVPVDPTAVIGAEKIGQDAGLYLSGWITEPDRQSTATGVMDTPKILVIWEGTRLKGSAEGFWNWTHTTITYYPHTDPGLELFTQSRRRPSAESK